MQFFMLDTAEWQSDRFLRLCEYMEMDETEERRMLMRGYFSTFVCRWAQDKQTDAGLFFNTPPRRLGIWAGAPKAEKFGNGLMDVGYVFDMAQKYPASVLAGRSGLVYWGALDITWRSVHCERMNKRDLVLFRADAEKRSRAALSMGIRPEEFPGAPGEYQGSPDQYPGWIMPPERLRDPFVSDEPTPGEKTRGGSDGGTDGGTAGPPPAPPLPPRVRSGKEVTKLQRYVRTGKTGKAKTGEQRDVIVAYKYTDTGRALLALDETPLARGTWDAILQHDPGFAQTVLAELTETPQAWEGSTNPPGLAFSRCRGRLKQMNVDVTPYVETYTRRATLERGGGGIGFES